MAHKDISIVSIKNYLHNNGFYAYSPIKKPLLSAKNINRRYGLSGEFIKMTSEEMKQIKFSDESKFNLFFSDRKVCVWREPGKGLISKNLIPTVKHGDVSVMVSGCFSYHGVGKLHFIEGIMDAAEYCSILDENLFESASMMGLEKFIFQQDNDPKHTKRL